MTAFPSGRCGGGREGVCEKRYLITLLPSFFISVKLSLFVKHTHACMHSQPRTDTHTQRIFGYPKKTTFHSNTTDLIRAFTEWQLTSLKVTTVHYRAAGSCSIQWSVKHKIQLIGIHYTTLE